jgi:hypothetical protein
LSPHTTARPSDAREVTTGVWLMSRDQFDADFQFQSYVTPAHCRTSLLVTSRYTGDICRNVFLRPLSPETLRKRASDVVGRRNIGLLLAPIVCFLSVTKQGQLVLQHGVYTNIHVTPTKYDVMNPQLTNIPDVPVCFFISRSRKVQRQKPTRGGNLKQAET